MSSKWREVKVKDVLYTTDFVANGSFASLKENVTYRDSPDYAVMIRLVDFNNGWNGNFVYLDKSSYDFLRKSFVEPKDVIISNVGANVGTVFQAPELNTKMTLGPNSILIKPDNDDVDRDYIYYFFTSRIGQGKIQGVVSGSAQPKFNKTDFRSIEFPLPPLSTQKKIAHILSTLDDKIELNRKMNQTLEAMAQALFKSWFVDFDPVHVKAGCKSDAELERGARELGISKEVLELFPSEFEESELGMIPKGWEIETIGDNFELLGGFAFKSSQYNDEGEYGLVTIKNVQDGKFIEECANHIADIPNKIKTHCILKSGDILLSLTGNVGRVCIVSKGKYLLNQRVSKLISKKDLPLSYPYFYFRSSQVYKSMLGIAKGTAQLNLSPIETAKLKMIKPNVNILNSVKDIFNNLFSQIVDNNNQVQTLQQTRDTLLPKLLSGELDVSEIEIEGL